MVITVYIIASALWILSLLTYLGVDVLYYGQHSKAKDMMLFLSIILALVGGASMLVSAFLLIYDF